MTTRLILVRHGHTASNGLSPDPRMSGWTDLPLSALGRKQAQALRLRFLNAAPFAAVYSSPLKRAQDTASPIAQLSQVPLRLLSDLREINCGDVDGLPIAEVKRNHPDLWEENLRQTNPHFRWPGGESYIELRTRSLHALGRIARTHPMQRVLVVTHAGVISQVVGALRGHSPASWESFRPENASLTELDWVSPEPQVIVFNDHSYLVDIQVDKAVAAEP